MANILIIDDDPDIRLAARLCLEDAGHTVIEASNSEEGLEKLKADHPNLIVLDVMMEQATEGFQLALTLRGPDAAPEYREIPILMVTAIHTTTPLRFGPDDDYLPVDEFIDKPIDPDVLVQKVDALLNK